MAAVQIVGPALADSEPVLTDDALSEFLTLLAYDLLP